MNTQHTRKRFVGAVAGVFAALVLVTSFAAQNVSQSELQFREALHKQQVQGDLRGAIKLYESIVASKTTDRALKAKALLQLALAYDTLGRQSQNLYQQIVHDFSDQPAATQAKAKLAALRPPAAVPTATMRKVDFGIGVDNVVATDGQRAVYWDSSHTTLLIGDVAGKDKRTIYQTNRRPMTIVSRDLSMVFFFFPGRQQEPASYSVMRTDGTGYRELSLIENGHVVPVGLEQGAVSWSWDNRYLVMVKPQVTLTAAAVNSGNRLLKISVADGQVVDLLPARSTPAIWAIFSPDGRFVAYSTGRFPGPIYIVPSQGGAPTQIREDAVLMDWTRDGYLMLGERRSGTILLSAVPIANGKPSAEHISLGSGPWPAGGVDLIGITINGTIIVRMRGMSTRLSQDFLGTLDPRGRVESWQALDLVDNGTEPAWAADSRQIVYVARARPLSPAVRVRNVATGQDREVARIEGVLVSCAWAQQHPALYCGRQAGSQTEILSVSLDSGRAQTLGSLDGRRVVRRVSPDDRLLITTKAGEAGVGYQWEVGTEREIKVLNPVQTSADGRWIYSSQTRNSENRRQIGIRPTSGGDDDWRPAVYPRIDGNLFTAQLTPDGNWLIYRDKDIGGKDGLYRVSTTNGEPERLGDYPSDQPDFNRWPPISPDGRHIIVSVRLPQDQSEIWALDQNVPRRSPAPAKSGAKPSTK